jgi:hypothetical protein
VSGFSADWLALREPVDERARSRELLSALRRRFAGRDALAIVDLGCGTGASLRATAAHLPPRQHWRLVDHDAALLAAARSRLAQWADSAQPADDHLRLRKGQCQLLVSFVEADLAASVEETLDGAVDLVTATALFDLVSAAWIKRFASAVVNREAVFYTALTYNGIAHWQPPHPADPAVLAAFHAHQERDKGFGGSVGQRATDVLVRHFRALGYEVATGDSPWRLEVREAVLIRELAEGVAQAVRETGQVTDDEIAGWIAARRADVSCTIGHTDCLAFPRSTREP